METPAAEFCEQLKWRSWVCPRPADFRDSPSHPGGCAEASYVGTCRLEARDGACRLAGAWGEGSLGGGQSVHKGSSGEGLECWARTLD